MPFAERMKQIIRLRAQGYTAEQIAAETGLTPGRIRHLFTMINEYLGADNMFQAGVMAKRRDLVE